MVSEKTTEDNATFVPPTVDAPEVATHTSIGTKIDRASNASEERQWLKTSVSSLMQSSQKVNEMLVQFMTMQMKKQDKKRKKRRHRRSSDSSSSNESNDSNDVTEPSRKRKRRE